MKHALIDPRGLVVQVESEPFYVHPPFQWVECPADAVAHHPDWLYQDGAVVYVPMPQAAPAVPRAVSRFQARAALHQAGLLAGIEAAMSDPATPMIQRLAWQDAQEFRRDSQTVAALAARLNLSAAQLDALFIAASGITA